MTKHTHTVGQKIKKNPGQKSSWNQINQFPEIFFAISKMAKNELEKSLKLPKMQFNEKKNLIYLILQVF